MARSDAAHQTRASLEQTRAGIQLKSPDPKVKLEAIKVLGQSNEQRTKLVLLPLLDKNPDGSYVEADEKVRSELALPLQHWRLEPVA